MLAEPLDLGFQSVSPGLAIGQPLDLGLEAFDFCLGELAGKFINVELNPVVIGNFGGQPLDLGLRRAFSSSLTRIAV